MRKVSLFVHISVTVLVAIVPLCAETSNAASDKRVIVVTGTKFDQEQQDASEKVEVITEDDIQESGAKNLTEALQNIPGITITGHPIQSIMIQGLSGAHVRIMIDGIKVTGDIGGSTPSYKIPLSAIERIEIIRGASSALYGSDAMGGVVNVITKRHNASTAKRSVELNQEVTSSLRSFTAIHSKYATDDFALSFSGSFDIDTGKTKNKGEGHEIYEVPHNRLGFARLQAGWHNSDQEVTIFSAYSNSFLEANSSDSYKYNFHSHTINAGVSGEKQLTEELSFSGYVSGSYNGMQNRNRDYALGSSGGTDTDFADGEAELRAEFIPSIQHSIIFGVNARYETIQGDAFEGIKTNLLLSGFAQGAWNIGGMDRFTITTGGRFDFSPAIHASDPVLVQATPKVSLRMVPFEKTVMRASYGMGYRVPTLKHKYWVFFHAAGGGFYILGNPNLKSETSHGFNLSVDQQIGSILRLSASGYFNLVDNLITTQANPGDSNFSYQNATNARTYGGNIDLRFTKGHYSASVSYAYTVAKSWNKILNRDLYLTGRVPHSIGVTSSLVIPSWGLKTNVSLKWDSPQLINNLVNFVSPDKLIVNGGVEKSFGEKFDLYLRGENLLNNLHFVTGSGGPHEGKSQKEYFHLHDGFILTIGGRLKL